MHTVREECHVTAGTVSMVLQNLAAVAVVVFFSQARLLG